MPEEPAPPITLSTRCQECGRSETIGFGRGRDVRLPVRWDIWGEDVRCGECAGRAWADPPAAGPPLPTVLYVATNLDAWAPEHPEIFARDVIVNGTAFRRLDEEYFAWLAGRLERARGACDAGTVAPEALVQVELRWVRVRRWAEDAFGRETVVAAEARGSEPMVYEPPAARELGFTLPAARPSEQGTPAAARLPSRSGHRRVRPLYRIA